MTADGGTPGSGGFGGGPHQLPPVTGGGPDWAALAEANEREHRRRRLRLRIGAGALGVALIGGLVAAAVALSGPSDRPGTGSAPAVTAQPDGPASDSPGPSDSASASPSPSASASASPSGSAQPSGPASAPAGAKSTDGPAAPPNAPAPTLPGLTLGGSASVGSTAGHTGPTLVLHGFADGWADSGSPVVDTSRSFTVSAVVRNNAPTGGRAVVSQGSDSYYSFYLGRDDWGTHNQWVFKVQTAAGAQDNTTYQAFSTAAGAATTGRWTLLTGVYDAGAKKITLYVDGVLQQTTAVQGVWQTTGGLQLGRVRYKNTWSDFWDGAISDVQVWNQALPATAVAQLNGSGGTSAGTAAERAWLLP
ncbi:LamG domain-containing protein [Kitasatospora sp. NPDC092948]|uniref:LamG domain-containing protein n=1 Tax=Kitasatospora sp. NPDC092948 TaxID=3364088 RepID=UPI0037F3D00E